MMHPGVGTWLRCTAAGLLLVHAATALAWDTVATVALDVASSDFHPQLISVPDANGFWAFGGVTAPFYAFDQTALVHYADADHVVTVTPVADPTFGTYGQSPYPWSLVGLPDGGVVATLVGSNVDSPQFYGWSCHLQRYDAQGVMRWTTVTYSYSGVGLSILYCPTPQVDLLGSVWIALDESTQLTRLAPDGSAAAQIELGSGSFGSQPDGTGGVYIFGADYLARYGSDASPQWRIDSTALSMYPRVLIDAGGNVNLIGLASRQLTTRSYTPAGALRWATSLSAPGNGYLADAAASPDGKVYVSIVGGDTNSSAQLVAIGADGTPAWPEPFVTQTGANCSGPFAAPVRAAPNGDVLYLYAAASSCDGHTSLFRFRPDGTQVYTFPLGTSGFDYAEAVPGTLADGSTLLAAAGNYTRISTAGAALTPPPTVGIVAVTPTIDAQLAIDDGSSYVLASDHGANHHAFARFGADGTRLWQQTGEYFWQSAHIVSNGERVCVGGSVTTGSAAADIGITVRCFAAADGTPVWAWTGTGAPISALRLLADGRVVAIRAGGHLLIDGTGAVVHDIALPALANITAVDINAAGRAVVSTSVTAVNLVAIDSDGSTAYATSGLSDIAVPAPFALSVLDDATTVVACIGHSTAGTGLHVLRVSPQGTRLWKTFLTAYTNTDDYYPAAASIAQSGQVVYVAAVDASPSVAALNLDSGAAIWNVPLAGLRPVAPALELSSFTVLLKNPAGPQLLLLSDAGNKVRLTTFDTATGAIRRDRLEACADSPCVSESVALGSDGALHLASTPITGVTPLRPRIYTNVHPFATPAPIGIGQAGLDGAWFPAYTAGQGFTFDYIASASTLFVPWFTFTQSGINDPAGLAWYTLQGGGVTSGTTYADLAIAIPEPGVFNSGGVSGRQVGTAHLSFSDCNSGTLWYQFNTDTNNGAGGLITLTRLTPSTEPCTLADGSTTPAQNTNPPASGFDSHQSGSWFDPATSGQGLQLTIIPAGNGTAGIVFAAWFTFDPAGLSDDPNNQHWFTLQGDLSSAAGGKVTLPIYRIIGGAFDSTPTSNYSAVGQATLTMQGCDAALLDYRFDTSAVAHAFSGLGGTLHLVRIGGCVH